MSSGDKKLIKGKFGDPYGIRTRVAAVKGRCPKPLDEGVAQLAIYEAHHPSSITPISRSRKHHTQT